MRSNLLIWALRRKMTQVLLLIIFCPANLLLRCFWPRLHFLDLLFLSRTCVCVCVCVCTNNIQESDVTLHSHGASDISFDSSLNELKKLAVMQQKEIGFAVLLLIDILHDEATELMGDAVANLQRMIALRTPNP